MINFDDIDKEILKDLIVPFVVVALLAAAGFAGLWLWACYGG